MYFYDRESNISLIKTNQNSILDADIKKAQIKRT